MTETTQSGANLPEQKIVLLETTGYSPNGSTAPVELYYTTADPHAFTITVHEIKGDVVWQAARELLRELWNTVPDTIVGDGDLKFMRYTDDGPEMGSISFSSPFGTGYLDVPYSDLGTFTTNVYHALGYEYEMDDSELDDAILKLLGAS